MNFPIVPSVLTIAGSDSSGGAGIQADLKTFSAHRVFGKSVISSITAQSTLGVQESFPLPPAVVEQQLTALLEDGKPAAIKTGMLGDQHVVKSVVRLLKRYRVKKLVVDPVIRSSSGKVLLSAKGVQLLKEELLPRALIVTPNLSEAEALSGIRIRKPGDRLKAARAILKTGVRSVLITGGHLKGRPEDFFYDGSRPRLLDGERVTKESLHGTGCVLSAAIAANLANGHDLISAVVLAKEFVSVAIAGGVQSGKGLPSVEPLTSLYNSEEQWSLFQRVSEAIAIMKNERIGRLIPEVQSNLGVGLERAQNQEDVIAFAGRIIKNGDEVVTLSPPSFGGSKHVANIVLTAMRHDPSMRAAMNIKCDEGVLKACLKLKFSMASFDRAKEPKKVRSLEGSSLEWGTDSAIRKFGSVPDIIYDLGGMGKEEMVRVLAEDIETLTEKVLKIHRHYK